MTEPRGADRQAGEGFGAAHRADQRVGGIGGDGLAGERALRTGLCGVAAGQEAGDGHSSSGAGASDASEYGDLGEVKGRGLMGLAGGGSGCGVVKIGGDDLEVVELVECQAVERGHGAEAGLAGVAVSCGTVLGQQAAEDGVELGAAAGERVDEPVKLAGEVLDTGCGVGGAVLAQRLGEDGEPEGGWAEGQGSEPLVGGGRPEEVAGQGFIETEGVYQGA